MSILITVLVVYLVYLILLFLFQRQIIFPGQRLSAGPVPANLPEHLEEVHLALSDGTVEAWFLPAADTTSPKAVIFAHGNFELIDFCLEEALQYNRWGVDVLLVEYPGFGRSKGSPTENSITEACVKGYDWLTRRRSYPVNTILGHGRSLGGAAICALSARRPLAGIILQSSFFNMATMARRYLAPTFLIRDSFENGQAVERFNGPVLLLHGRYDTVIPFSHSERLAAKAAKGQLIPFDCGHNDFPIFSRKYEQVIRNFLKKIYKCI